MFNRSRRRIMLLLMSALVLLFGTTLSVLLLATYREVRQNNMDMLTHYADLYYLHQRPETAETDDWGPPEGERPEDRPAFELSTFYSVAFGADGEVLAADDGGKTLYTKDALAAVAREILAGGKESGRFNNLFYVRRIRPDYTLVAMMDITVAESGLTSLLRNFLAVSGGAIGVMFLLAVRLSRRIIRPLEENDRKQKQFISDASHELKTPVAVISANAEMLSRQIGENEWLTNILYENEHMGGLVKHLLELSRAENPQMPKERLDFSRMVTGEVLAFETMAFDRGKVVNSQVEDGIHLVGSRIQLTQLISVLLDNAVEHATGAQIDVSLKQKGQTAILTVANEGQEIPPEKRRHLFDRFYRVDEARTAEGQHYGLGLSIARAVAQSHGGSIRLDIQDSMVIFFVTLPIKKR